jgi:hypothetical protein
MNIPNPFPAVKGFVAVVMAPFWFCSAALLARHGPKMPTLRGVHREPLRYAQSDSKWSESAQGRLSRSALRQTESLPSPSLS